MAGSKSQVQPDRLLSASLLATTGGLLDAMVYVLHGHVFANAMSGNVILLGVTVFSRDWMQALRHLVPIFAFIAGVVASRFIRLLPQFYASVAVLALEMVVLFVAGLLPLTFPEMAFTAIIAFTSAFRSPPSGRSTTFPIIQPLSPATFGPRLRPSLRSFWYPMRANAAKKQPKPKSFSSFAAASCWERWLVPGHLRLSRTGPLAC